MAADKELLDYLEKTFADAYRKEIDQEENIWRSLPFFAATLALQLAAISAVGLRVTELAGWWFWAACVALGFAGIGSLGAIGWIAAAIYFAKFNYVSTEPSLLNYATALVDFTDYSAVTPVASLKAELLRQYAVATDNNRNINQRRARRRTIAGLFTLLSVLATVCLATLILAHHLSATAAGAHHVIDHPRPASSAEAGTPARPAGPYPAADARGREGPVAPAGNGPANPGSGATE